MISIEPFAQKHIEDAAKLFISSYKNQRENMGCLPVNYEKLETITRLLEGILETHPGVVAISDSKLVGYQTGFAKIPYFIGASPPPLNRARTSGPWVNSDHDTQLLLSETVG